MLSNNNKDRKVFRNVSIVLGLPLVRTIPFRGHVLNLTEFSFVACCLLENIRTNDFAKLSNVLALMGRAKKSMSMDSFVPRLIALGLIERPSWGCFVVTSEGEYWLRDIETMLGRITKNTDRSKWRKILDQNDPRAGYVRGARAAGSKIVSVPIDDRLKLKHGLPTIKKNGQPRNINLPGSNI